MVSINSAIQVDLTGQVCADSIGHRFYSGVGGQVDFVRGAARSKGGMPIIALLSTAKDDTISRIVPTLTPGSGVITTRNDVHYVATEYGVADLYGRTVRDRARMLVEIAHPKFRAELAEAAEQLYHVPQFVVPALPELGEMVLVISFWSHVTRCSFSLPLRLSERGLREGLKISYAKARSKTVWQRDASRLTKAICKGCTLCKIACPQEVIDMVTDHVNAKGYYPAVLVDPDGKCTGCALCAVACPDVCITVYRQVPFKGAPSARARDGVGVNKIMACSN